MRDEVEDGDEGNLREYWWVIDACFVLFIYYLIHTLYFCHTITQ